MATPTRKQLKAWADGYVEHWNSGDKEAWIANWKAVAPGHFQMFDPVGTPMKEGFEECAAASYDLFQPKVQFRITPGSLFICGSQVAWFLENHINADGNTNVGRSIETYEFGDDGSVFIRTWYDVPGKQDNELGAIFDEYLPDR